MAQFRIESDSMGKVKVPNDRLWGAQTQRSLEHFCIGNDLMPRELIFAYAIIKKASAKANSLEGVLPKWKAEMITRVCDEILAGMPLYASYKID